MFFPTGILHSLPLHALRVGPRGQGEILIVRNPITYCASLTSFVQCCRRANSVTTTDIKPNKRLLAVYERESGDQLDNKNFSDEERHQVYLSIKSLAEELRGESLCGEEVTYQTFKESLEKSDFIHFHGHCDFDTKVIADQSLRILGDSGAAGLFSLSIVKWPFLTSK